MSLLQVMGGSGVVVERLRKGNETTWLQLGAFAEQQENFEKAVYCYDRALAWNPMCVKALSAMAAISKRREAFPKAIEYLNMILTVEPDNGEVWGALGHCNLMLDDLKKAHEAYQKALLNLPNPKDANVWYGIGLVYVRAECLDQAEEAFTGVLKMEPRFAKRNDISFHLGVIFKQKKQLDRALQCFQYLLTNPPDPMTQSDVWFQIGHTYELMKEFERAREAYTRVAQHDPKNPKVLQRLGWVLHSHGRNDHDREQGMAHMLRAVQLEHMDGHGWYMLGRIYMDQNKHRRCFDAIQQAIYREPDNGLFWCLIGILYIKMEQHRDALHALIRSIRLDPHLGEGWFNIGMLYEACGQPKDAIDAYKRACELPLPLPSIAEERLAAARAGLEIHTSSSNGSKMAPPSMVPLLPDSSALPSKTKPTIHLPDLVIPMPDSGSRVPGHLQGSHTTTRQSSAILSSGTTDLS